MGKRLSIGMTGFLLSVVMIIWGANFVVLKFGLKQLSPEVFTALRYMIASPLFLLLALQFKISLKIDKMDWLKIFILGLVYTSFYQVLFAAAVGYTTAGNSSLIMATSPLFAAIMSGILGYEKFTAKSVAGMLLSFLGVFIVVRSAYVVNVFSSTLKGDILALLASIVFASYAIFLRGLLIHYHYLSLMFYSSVIGGILLAVYSWKDIILLLDTGLEFPAMFSLGYSILGVTVYGFSFWYYSIDRLGPSKTVLFMNLNPIVSVIVSVLVLGEVITSIKVFGILLTLVGLNFARRHIRKAPSEAIVVNKKDS